MYQLKELLKGFSGLEQDVSRVRLLSRIFLTVLFSAVVLYSQIYLQTEIEHTPYLLVYPAIFVISYFWGFLPGLTAWTICLLGVAYFLLTPYENFLVADRDDILSVILYLVLGLFIVYSNHRSYQLKRSLRRALISSIDSEQKRSRSDSLLNRLSDLNLMGIIYFDSSGLVKDANETFLRMVNYTRQELNEGKVNWKTMTPGGWRNADAKALVELAEKGFFEPFEKEYVSKSGELIPILIGGGLFHGSDHEGGSFVLDLRRQRESEKIQKELQRLVENTDHFIALADSDSNLIYLNEAGRRILGADQTDDLNKLNILNLIRSPQFDGRRSGVGLGALIAEHYEQDVLLDSPFSDRMIPIRLQAFPLNDSDSQYCQRYAFVGRDLRSEIESAERLKTALNVAQMAIWEYDVNSKKYFRSEEHDRLYGLEPSSLEWTDEKFYSLIHPLDRERVAHYFRDLIKGTETEFSISYRVPLPNQDDRWLSARGNLIRDCHGRALLIIGGILDVTTLKRAEIELKQVLIRRDQFISIASHELKTPLTSLQLQLELVNRHLRLLQDGKVSKFEPVLEAVTDSRAQFQRLTSLVNDLLDLTRIANGKLQMCLETQDLKKMLEGAVRTLKASVPIEFKAGPSEEVYVYLDEERMMQVITNLLSNAIKFGNGKPIEVSLGYHEEKNVAWFSIQDHGIGIAKNEIDRIFERFGQGSSGHEKEGLGLGLFITKEIVKGHRGEIFVESELGKGTKFTIEIPLPVMGQRKLSVNEYR